MLNGWGLFNEALCAKSTGYSATENKSYFASAWPL